MKMRLNFCRALLHRPTVLLLDEPTAGLDPGNAQIIKDWIRERANAGTTIVITTHNMHVAETLCHRVAFMVNFDSGWQWLTMLLPPYWAVQALVVADIGRFWAFWVGGVAIHGGILFGLLGWWQRRSGSW
jgi:ABC-type cobalamin/Fe3+-siderophores transport system ATPase subunit